MGAFFHVQFGNEAAPGEHLQARLQMGQECKTFEVHADR